ncbi:LOW QUALITY PROTEIN: uncharacterized protein LOC123987984 [Osmia bicornis bicornis]|uniref:LOW QUALITY PROTEIN: uncharacterized protein LOC123987984 n=1 Tax=Osmia bicornis bicornis TaxID=1437191 RepID=UPI001EAEC74A|nr:LOW QUALITY PROTEIN: uncharacterized protein LOC123987984 [Osmia bicornis bicornis]
MKEKVLALALYKQSGRCYRLLESIFHLPSARSLRQILNRINVNTGCNQFICRQLQEKGTTMSSIDKVCCVMFDEMAIQPHVEYDPVSDCIVGFEDCQTIRTMKYADHALVFMIRGIHTGWKFPVAYYFTENQASTAHLVQCNTIYLAGVEICPLYDPPHLMKGIRNNLLNKDIELDFKNEGGMETEIGHLRMPVKQGHDTAEMALFFDRLFDSVNGHSVKPETELRSIVTRKSNHGEFWGSAIKKLSEMRFVSISTHCPVHTTPVLKHWQATIGGFQPLWQLLQRLGFKYFRPRYLNQDPLENFFGCIRSLNYRYTNPTAKHFKSNFKTLLVNNLSSKNSFGNCETICDGNLLLTFETLNTGTPNHNQEYPIENMLHQSTPAISEQNNSVQNNFKKTYQLLLQHLPNICHT